jgi:hypothetical protein
MLLFERDQPAFVDGQRDEIVIEAGHRFPKIWFVNTSIYATKGRHISRSLMARGGVELMNLEAGILEQWPDDRAALGLLEMIWKPAV